jgi:hypothetical protein
MVNPGKAKGGSLMIIFLTMVSDIHRHSVDALPFNSVIRHKARKFQFYGIRLEFSNQFNRIRVGGKSG